jgi:hypothetical protein
MRLAAPCADKAGILGEFMTTDEEIEAAVKAMRAIRLRDGKVHDDVLRAYARAALQAVCRCRGAAQCALTRRGGDERAFRRGKNP